MYSQHIVCAKYIEKVFSCYYGNTVLRYTFQNKFDQELLPTMDATFQELNFNNTIKNYLILKIHVSFALKM